MIRQEPMNDAHLKALLAVATKDGPRSRCMLTIASRHFVRASELANIRVADVNLRDGSIMVRRLKGSISKVESLQPGDREALETWLAVKPKSAFLFPSPDPNKPLSRAQIYNVFRRLAETAGVPSCSRAPHAFRHTIGQRMAEAGAPAKLIQQSAGHKNLNSTSQYFEFRQSHVDAEKTKYLGLVAA
jgi:integrase/recombinase XerD